MRSVAREREVSKDLFIEGAASRAVSVVVAGADPSPNLNSVCPCVSVCLSVWASAGAHSRITFCKKFKSVGFVNVSRHVGAQTCAGAQTRAGAQTLVLQMFSVTHHMSIFPKNHRDVVSDEHI